MNSINNQNEINVGVDTGKTQLNIYIRPLGIYFNVTNMEMALKPEQIRLMSDLLSRRRQLMEMQTMEKTVCK